MARIETIADGVTLYLGDCREILPKLGKVDAVVTDPPYGIGADEAARAAALSRIKANGRSKAGRGWCDYGESQWDRERPAPSTFEAILACSKHQIIWGGNYFTDILPPTMQWLIWDKGQRDFSLADFEMAWSSQWSAGRIIDYPRSLALKDGKEHPTQKPIQVMVWCLQTLPEASVTVCDPFMGTGTTGIAAVKMGRKFIGIEIEPKYFEIACRRISEALKQPDMFIEQLKPIKQLSWNEMWSKPFDRPELVWGPEAKKS